MHDLEPYWRWRDKYIAAEDERSPFFGRVYSEFTFSNKVYNYFIHPQWDDFGSATLYGKIIFADYVNNFAIIELIGEWNDCLYNDIMFLKQQVIDQLFAEGITKYILIGENVLNFHGDDTAYYQEWREEVSEYDGWIVLLNLREHVVEEMVNTELQYYLTFDPPFDEINWRTQKPMILFRTIDAMVKNPSTFRLGGM